MSDCPERKLFRKSIWTTESANMFKLHFLRVPQFGKNIRLNTVTVKHNFHITRNSLLVANSEHYLSTQEI